MSIDAGEYELGPEHADLRLFTHKEGLAGAVGHDLALLVQRWSAVLVSGSEPSDCELMVRADLSSLCVESGSGGAKPLSAKDRRDIEANAAGALDVRRHPELTFVSTGITGSWDSATVTGELTLHGRSGRETFTLTADGNGGYTLVGRVAQSKYGIKPFSAMLGALRISDEVGFEVGVGF